MTALEPIAIIGMACRLAGGVDSPEAFWKLLRQGHDATGELPPGRWDWYASRGREHAAAVARVTRRGAFLDDVAGFDADFFGITPREAELMDPQQRMVLELAWEALEHAGLPPVNLAGSDAGVFVGVGADDYGRRLLEDLPRIEAWTGVGAGYCGVANRVSYLLDLRGPSLAVDTACSSSLVALHLAAQALRAGECPVALAGGVLVMAAPGLSMVLDAAGATAPDGRSKAFDAAADGYGRGEGGGVVVLKRLADARRDGDRVLAVLRGSGVHQDGRTDGIMAPSGPAQAHLLRRTYRAAGIDPATVGYVEAHGTGTRRGDPLEAEALSAVLGAGRPRGRPLLIGSVKTNVGHLEAGAGVTGVIKAVLALRHGEIPPSLHLNVPNPAIPWDSCGLRVVTEATPWPDGDGPRRAGVSAYGYGGTIAHVILEAADPAPTAPTAGTTRTAETSRAPQATSPATPSTAEPSTVGPVPAVYPLSGAGPEGVRRYATRLADHLATHTGIPLADVAHTLAHRRAQLPYRMAVTAADRAELVARLRAAGDPAGSPGGRVLPGAERGVVWVFSGHGSQWTGMGRELLATDPAFAAVLNRLEPVFRAEIGLSPTAALLDDEPHPVDVVQPMIFAMQVGLAASLRARGLRPAAVIGHSVGEIAAAVTAGVFSLEQGARLVCRRSALLRRVAGQGAMAMVDLPPERVERLLAGHRDVSLAIAAAPSSAVVSGTVAAVEKISTRWLAEGRTVRPVDTDVAFHSPQMEPLLRDLVGAAADLPPAAPTVPIYSTALVDPRSTAPRDGAYWAANLRGLVRLGSAVSAAATDGYRLFIEVSAHPVVEHSIAETLDGLGVQDTCVTHTLRRARPERDTLLANLGLLWCHGAPVDGTRLWPTGRLADLPTTAWLHRPHWYREPAGRSFLTEQHNPEGHTLLGGRINVYGARPARAWLTYLDRESRPYPGDHPVRGVEILPAAVLLNTFLAAGREADAPPALTDVALRIPVSTGSPRYLQVVLQDGVLRLASRIADEDGDGDDPGWTTHTTAALAPPDGPDPDPVWTVRTTDELPAGHVIERLATLGVAAMGFPWQVERLGRGPDGLVAVVRAEASPSGATVPTTATATATGPARPHPSGPTTAQPHPSDPTNARPHPSDPTTGQPRSSGTTTNQPHPGDTRTDRSYLTGTTTDQPHLGGIDAERSSPRNTATDRPNFGDTAEDRPHPDGPGAGHPAGTAPVAAVELPPDAPASWAPVLDAALSVASVAFPGPPVLRMPAHIDRVALSAEPPNPARVTVRRDGDETVHVEIADADGKVRGRLHGLRYGVLDGGSDAVVDPHRILHTVAWRPLPGHSHRPPKAVLLVGPEGPVHSRLTGQLRLAGVPYRVVADPDLIRDGDLTGGTAVVVVPPDGRTANPATLAAPANPAAPANLAAPANAANAASAACWLLARTAQRLARAGAATPDVSVLDGEAPDHRPDGTAASEAAGHRPTGTADGGTADHHTNGTAASETASHHPTITADGETADHHTNGEARRHHTSGTAIDEAAGGKDGRAGSEAAGRKDGRAGNAAHRAGGVRLWCVTEGVRESGRPESLGHGPVWGLGRVIGGEHPDLWGAVVDVGPGTADCAALVGLLGSQHDESVIAIRDGRPEVPRLHRPAGAAPRPPLTCRPDGTYLITGGLGALGLEVARWLADRGARRIVLAGRRELPPRDGWDGHGDPWVRRTAAVVRELERIGVTVFTVRIDVADPEAVAARLSPASLGLPPLRGVVHAAGVLDSRPVLRLDERSLLTVLRPKVDGALALHAAFPPGSLDFFVLFSSCGGLLGLPGQASYAAGNAFLDALAAHRRAAGDTGSLSLGWTSWRGLGMSTSSEVIDLELAARGTADITATDAFAAWDLATRYGAEHAVVLRTLPPEPGVRRPPLLSELPVERAADGEGDRAAAPAPEAGWRAFDGAALRAYLVGEVRREVAAVTRLPVGEIDARRPLSEMGLDSVMTVRIRVSLERTFRLPLPATLFWDRPSVDAVAGLLADRLAGTTTDEASTQPTTSTTTDDPDTQPATNTGTGEPDTRPTTGTTPDEASTRPSTRTTTDRSGTQPTTGTTTNGPDTQPATSAGRAVPDTRPTTGTTPNEASTRPSTRTTTDRSGTQPTTGTTTDDPDTQPATSAGRAVPDTRPPTGTTPNEASTQPTTSTITDDPDTQPATNTGTDEPDTRPTTDTTGGPGRAAGPNREHHEAGQYVPGGDQR